MFCVACMMYAFDVAVTCAIAALFMSKEKTYTKQNVFKKRVRRLF